jgi:hypothetical protein
MDMDQINALEENEKKRITNNCFNDAIFFI